MSNNTIDINPAMLIWARERAGEGGFALVRRFPKLPEWEAGTAQPTLRQLEDFAHAAHVPIGYLFLPEPVHETLPISDFRTLADRTSARPSPNLLDTLYLCQQRQDWYRDYARMSGLPSLDFIGSVTLESDPVAVAESMRKVLGLSVQERQQSSRWEDALRQLVTKAEDTGVLVMASSIVGSNSHRKLRVAEFRGFALVDDLAPLIFINAADSKSAQMFTLGHELAHLWLGESGISNTEAGHLPEQRLERWCNTVAAELLMPIDETRAAYQPEHPLGEEIQRLARLFKVSTLVTLRRLFEAGFIDREELWQQYEIERMRIGALIPRADGGGDFYRTLGTRTGKRFARAVLTSTLEGQTLFRDAFHMLGMKKNTTFYQTAHKLGVMP